jgi:sulfur carrier protein ThiS
MKIYVTSYISWRSDLTKEYALEKPINIVHFIESLKLTWNQDALVVVNDQIVNQDYLIQEGDRIHLLLPILGG